jgi:hypothetical protein
LALFIFGIRLLNAGMEKLAGDQIQKWLDRVTSNRLKSAIFGAVATAVIQSSGLLMVAMIGLINANLLTVQQSIGVMLGQKIGTTFTAQIVAFDIGPYRLLLVIVGIILLEFFAVFVMDIIARMTSAPLRANSGEISQIYRMIASGRHSTRQCPWVKTCRKAPSSAAIPTGKSKLTIQTRRTNQAGRLALKTRSNREVCMVPPHLTAIQTAANACSAV